MKMIKSNRIGLVILAVFVLGILAISGCGNNTGRVVANNADVTIYKSQSCGCCSVYIRYLQDKGLEVNVVEKYDISDIKTEYGVPMSLQSCHTTIIDGYFIEGHVPIEAINKLLEEKPDIKGITLPGMPSGSPGMPGSKTGQFIVYAIGNDGSQSEFMRI